MFASELITKRDMSRDQTWILESPLIYENETYRITVLPGFDFDFASIPWFFRRVLPKNGAKYDRASCLHDALYASKIFDKQYCDLIFYNAMLEDGVNALVASLMYEAVDTFGDSAYNESDDLIRYRNLVKVEVLNVRDCI